MTKKKFETLDGINSDGAVVVANTLTVSANVAVDTDTLFVDTTNDRVGVNTSPGAYALDVSGDIRSTANVIGTHFVGDVDGANAIMSDTVQGGTLTDGTLSITSGTLTSGTAATFSGQVQVGTLTDGIATLTNGDITGANNGTFVLQVLAGTLTDGTATLNSGAFNAATGDFTGQVNAVTLTDGTLISEAGTVTGGVSITSTDFVGDLTGDVAGANAIMTHTVSANTLTDGILSSTDGAITGALSITSQAFAGPLTGNVLGDLTGDVDGTVGDFSGQLNVGTLTDGTATLTGGNITGANNGTFALQVQAGSFYDGTATLSGGNITNASRITSTDFVGNLDGNVEGNLTGNVLGDLTGDVAGANAIMTHTVSANTLTDGILSSTDGVITGASTINSTNFVGELDGNAATVTNGVYTNGNQEIAGVKTFTSSIISNLTGDVLGDLTGDVTGTVTDISNHSTSDLSEGSNKYHTTTRARDSISVTDSPGGDGALSYASGTGVITYTGPNATQVRAHFSGGTGVSISGGQISIGQPVGTTDTVAFNAVNAGVITATTNFAGPLTGDVTGDIAGANAIMTHTVSANKLTDGVLSSEDGAITDALSITSAAFVGDLTGDVAGNIDGATGGFSGQVQAGSFYDGTATLSGGNITNAGTITSAAFVGALTGSATQLGNQPASSYLRSDADDSNSKRLTFTKTSASGSALRMNDDATLSLGTGDDVEFTHNGTLLNVTGSDVSFDNNTLYVDVSANSVGINTAPNSLGEDYALDVDGKVRAGFFHGDGSNLTGISVAGVATDGNALKLNNFTSSQYLRSDVNDVQSSLLTFSNTASGPALKMNDSSTLALGTGDDVQFTFDGSTNKLNVTGSNVAFDTDTLFIDTSGTGSVGVNATPTAGVALTVGGKIVGTVITASTNFAGNLTGDVTGDVTGSATQLGNQPASKYLRSDVNALHTAGQLTFDTGSGGLKVNDNVPIGIGTGSDVTMKWDGSKLIIAGAGATINGFADNLATGAADSDVLVPTSASVKAYVDAVDTDAVSEGSTNEYYTDAKVDAYINASINTSDVSEGSRLYYTNARADVRVNTIVADYLPLAGGDITGDITTTGEINIDDGNWVAWGGGTGRPLIMGNKTDGNLKFYIAGAIRAQLNTSSMAFNVADVQIQNKLSHVGDADNYLSFGTNTLNLTQGGTSSLTATATDINVFKTLDMDPVDGTNSIHSKVDYTTGNQSISSAFFDLNVSGTDTATADRTHMGIQVDVDSSYTGGDNSNEGRTYGIHATSTSSGDNDVVVGGYFLGQTSGTASGVATNTSTVYGVYGQADQNRATLNTTQIGVYGYSAMDNGTAASTTQVTAAYGVYGLHNNGTTGTTGRVVNAHGLYGKITCGEGEIGTAYGARTLIDHNAGEITTAYLYHGQYSVSGTPTTTKWGIKLLGSTVNQIEGTIRLDDGSANAPVLVNSVDQNSGIYWPENDVVAIATGGVRRISIVNTGLDVNGAITVSGLVDGRDIAADGTKLDSIADDANEYLDADADARVDVGFTAKTTDDLSVGTTNKYFTNELVDDRVNSLIVGGSNISTTYNDTAGTLTINATAAITEVASGAGLTGGDTSGVVTLAVGGGTGITVTADEVAIDDTVVTKLGAQTLTNKSIAVTQLTGTIATAILPDLTVSEFATASIQLGTEDFVDSDSVLMTAKAVQDKITSYNYTTATGTITGVTAGNGLTGGGTSGTATLTVVGGTGITVTADEVALSNITGVVGSYGSATNIPQITVDAQGRITAAGVITVADSTNATNLTQGFLHNDRFNADITLSGTMTAANFNSTSDARLKDNIETLDGTKVYNMRGVSYTKGGKEESGVIAQELQEIAPELVDNTGEYLTVSYGNLVGYLIEAVKDLKEEVEILKNK